VPKTIYTVVQPDHLASIASDHQLASFAKTWNDPDNAELRKRRESPNALLPGDTVTIPERNPKVFERPTGKVHTFTVNVMPLKLRLVLLDEYAQPIANTSGTLTVDGADQDVQTDGDGLIEAIVDNDAQNASLVLDTRTFSFVIGHLDPSDETSGQLARLKSLGYFDGDVPEAAAFDQQRRDIEVEMRLAWELFQDANGLPLTGEPSDDAVSKLKEVFGG